ncbi:MAG TPA: hypothetical protein VLF61_00720, partial [Rhabdochlamydiaceae bacterium]|nr:hypothetical protein [Rhabdochlamydiaceae bacterium]
VTPAQKEPPPPSEQEKAKKAKKKAAPEKVVKPALKKVKLEPPLKAAPKPVKETPKEEAFPEKLLGMPAKEKEKVEEEAETLETAPSPPLPTGSWESVKEKSENKEIEAAAAPSIVPMEIAPIVYEVPTPSFAPLFTPFAAFPQMWDLFDRMVGVMTVMTDSGITETTINLTSEQFKASPFYGTQIIVREFSTAPKVFNIEMLVPTQVAGQIQANYNELVAAFEAGKYNFKVNRLEWRELPARKEEKKGKVTRIKKKKE